MLLFVVILGLCCCSKESNQSPLGRPQLSGPSEASVKQIVTFVCELETYPKNEPILLQLIQKGNQSRVLGESTSLSGGTGSFVKEIKRKHEGYLECRASLQNNTSIEATVSDLHYLKVFVPVKGVSIVIKSGASEFFERTTLKLVCSVSEGTDVSYKWLMNGQLIASSRFHFASSEQLWINSTTSKDSGSYMCIATNHFSRTTYSSNSSQVIITVKDLVSDPEISFKVLKETSDNYTALVTCNSTRGTPPVTFSLYSNEQLVASMTREANLEAEFKVPLVLGQHMGFLQCRANNTDRITQSLQMALAVVRVGGRVTIHYETETGEAYSVVGLRLYCKVETGTHPEYQWFLNDTLLDGRGNFYYVVHQSPEQSMLRLSVDRRSAGTYHCKVSDIANTTAISSRKHYLDKEVLNRLPDLLVGFVFGCFTLVILLVSACCCAGVLFRNKQYGDTSVTGLEMVRMAAAYEDELDLSGYSEDADEMKTPREDEFDQASEASLEEWPGIVKQKKT
ncbi:Fc receptor-like protein 3 isoform X2 [Mastacembelus armatus]|uniref:Fc receptor-like protein 3 isoform X2 n=1 Tax=Mastacembelus armatus TaxID=205130 RepID=UPI000E453FBF|nr:Fc receptor-like protein 3 isoform X2 [Mastacembelus armatus]